MLFLSTTVYALISCPQEDIILNSKLYRTPWLTKHSVLEDGKLVRLHVLCIAMDVDEQ